MNERIIHEKIVDRLAFHAEHSRSIRLCDFVEIFPEVEYFQRRHSPKLVHVGDWFWVNSDSIWQISAYGNSPDALFMMIERIWNSN